MAERLATTRLAAADSANAFAADPDRAPLSTRLLAYLLDSVVLFAFTMLVAALAGLSMFLRTHGGDQAVTDTDQWLSIAIFLATIPAWLLLNLLLGLKLGQTPGQYVLGLQVVQEDGSAASPQRLLGYWLALHPLFYHPLFGAIWLVLAWAALLSEVVFVFSLALAILCLTAPLAALIHAVVDPQNRAIHDRLAGVKVVRLS
jgi:uncharacterized RDD family membrane protein YckC